MLRIKLVKSPIGNNIRNRRTVAALGLRKVHQVVEQPDNPSIRGMIQHVLHMVTFEVVEGDVAPKPGKKPKAAKALAAPKSKPEPKPKAKAKPERPAKAEKKPTAAKKADASAPAKKPAASKSKKKEEA